MQLGVFFVIAPAEICNTFIFVYILRSVVVTIERKMMNTNLFVPMFRLEVCRAYQTAFFLM